MEIIQKNIEVQGVVVEYQTVQVPKDDLQIADLIMQGYWKAVESGNSFTFIKIINYKR